MAEAKNKAVLGLGVGVVAISGFFYLATRAKAAPIPPENIILTDLIIEPSEVYVGKSVSISVIATNIGGTKGSYEVTCEVI